MNKMGTMAWIWMGVLLAALVPAVLSVPVWLHNRYVGLMRTQTTLVHAEYELQVKIIDLDRQLRDMRSLTRIETVAKNMGLGYYEVPVKVMAVARNGEGK